MPSTIWNKYKLIKEINSNSNIKTYLASLEPIIKEITPKDKDDYDIIKERLNKLKEESAAYEIIEEDNKIYIVAENKDELSSKIDKLILTGEFIKEGITKKDIDDLFNIDKLPSKISFETSDKKKANAFGLFCQLNNCPMKYALFTKNNGTDGPSIKIGDKIYFDDFGKKPSLGSKASKKQIEITEDRRILTNKELDFTCIELFESDGIKSKIKSESKSPNKDILKLQDQNVNANIILSNGNILPINNNDIKGNASPEKGTSVSQNIKRSKKKSVTGIQSSGIQNIIKENKFNIANIFKYLVDDVKEKIEEKEKEEEEKLNKIICIYNPKGFNKEINLLHDYNLDSSILYLPESQKLYLKAKQMNTDIFENYMDVYINNQKIEFSYKYQLKEIKEVKVKFVFKKNLTNTSYMFYNCSHLKSIDLSSFITTNVKDMGNMFGYCSLLQSINLSSIDTTNVKNMENMFYGCSSLKSIDLSSFNTVNVKDMGCMFFACSSLKSIDLSSFNTTKVKNMTKMFDGCISLKRENIKVNNKEYLLLSQIKQDT